MYFIGQQNVMFGLENKSLKQRPESLSREHVLNRDQYHSLSQTSIGTYIRCGDKFVQWCDYQNGTSSLRYMEGSTRQQYLVLTFYSLSLYSIHVMLPYH